MQTLSDQDLKLVEKLNRHPRLKARMERVLAIAEDAGDDLIKAADAEQRVIEEMRRMGNEVLTHWAEGRVEKSAATLENSQAVAGSGKKNSTGTPRSGKSR